MGVLVKNIVDKNKYRMLSRKSSLKKHLHGLFIKIGGRKIPPGRIAEIDNKFQSQIDLLLQFKAIEITDGKDNHMPNFGKLKPYEITSRAMNLAGGQRTPPNVNVSTQDFPDFIVISTDEDLVFPDSLEDDPEEYVVESEESKVVVEDDKKVAEEVPVDPLEDKDPLLEDKDPLEEVVEKAFAKPEVTISDPPKKKRGRPKGSKNKKEKVDEIQNNE